MGFRVHKFKLYINTEPFQPDRRQSYHHPWSLIAIEIIPVILKLIHTRTEEVIKQIIVDNSR